MNRASLLRIAALFGLVGLIGTGLGIDASIRRDSEGADLLDEATLALVAGTNPAYLLANVNSVCTQQNAQSQGMVPSYGCAGNIGSQCWGCTNVAGTTYPLTAVGSGGSGGNATPAGGLQGCNTLNAISGFCLLNVNNQPYCNGNLNAQGCSGSVDTFTNEGYQARATGGRKGRSRAGHGGFDLRVDLVEGSGDFGNRIETRGFVPRVGQDLRVPGEIPSRG